jgi:anti-sigma-K factor RskA
MSDTDHNGTPTDDGRIVAGEYVLGVLDGNERREVARRIELDADLAREVAFWEERLGGLADSVRPVAPPDAVWSRIETAIAAPAPVSAAQRGGLWQSLVFWRALAIGSAALAAVCIAALAYVGSTIVRDERAPLLANIGQPSGQPGFVAAVGAGGALVIVPASLLTADQKSMELWLIPSAPAGTQPRPRSLGLISPNQAVRITVPSDLAPLVTPDASLAVSREELGGSRTGLPSNDIIAVGKFTNL